MTGEPVTPQTTLAIILGASEFPFAPRLDPLKPAGNAARDFAAYLGSDIGLNMPLSNILNLFDSDEPPNVIDNKISTFLRNCQESLKAKGNNIRDLIFYYVGHGGFTGGDQGYFLALRTTTENREGPSSLRLVDLASTLTQDAPNLRRFLILDCCFSASAFQFFQQSSPAEAVRRSVLESLPRKGTALLCSSSKSKRSLAPKDDEYTMFSGSFLDVLRKGNPERDVALSLNEVGVEVLEDIKVKYAGNAVRPTVLSPDEREGDIASLPVFPNASRRQTGIEVRLTEVERMLQSSMKDLAEFREVSKSVSELNKRLDTLTIHGPQGPSIPSSPKPGDFANLRLTIPIEVRQELRELSYAWFFGVLWLVFAVGLSTVYFLLPFTAYDYLARVAFYIIEVVVVLSFCVLLLAQRHIIAWFQVFPRYPAEGQAWIQLPEVQDHLGDRYLRVMGIISIRSPWFEWGLILLTLVGLIALVSRLVISPAKPSG